MFELAAELRAAGDAPVHDLSLGNPSLEPPPAWRSAIFELLADEQPGLHRYMTNAGFEDVREFIAAHEGARYQVPFTGADITMTCGAAGGLNVLAHATLDPGDEVVVPAPYFSEYEHYCATVGARLVPVATRPPTFGLDAWAIVDAISSRTRWVLLNSPNNPTGAIYKSGELDALADALVLANRGRGVPILVVEDAPYRDLTFEGVGVPSLLGRYANTVLVTSHSKDLGLAGERIGYMLRAPTLFGREMLERAAAYCTRVLGFVNAPALMQRMLPKVLAGGGARVDVAVYARNCRRVAAHLRGLGFGVPTPEAGFFLFPALPERLRGDDGGDVTLTERLVRERTVVVPGTAFGAPGYLRLSLATDSATIDGALAAFDRVCR